MVLKWIDNRRHENVGTLIEGFNGILQSDAYAAYGNYAKAHPELTLMACWAHAFRKFRSALKTELTHAREMMKLLLIFTNLKKPGTGLASPTLPEKSSDPNSPNPSPKRSKRIWMALLQT